MILLRSAGIESWQKHRQSHQMRFAVNRIGRAEQMGQNSDL